MNFGMRRGLAVIAALLLIAGAAIAAILATGGGDSMTNSPVTTASSTSTQERKAQLSDKVVKPAKKPSGTGCKGISGTTSEGSCVEAGVRYVVVNRDSILRLPTLTVKLLGIETAKTITEKGKSVTAGGEFVTLELEVKNLTDSPVEFDEAQEQILLLLDGNIHFEDADVQKKLMDSSFLRQGVAIQPHDRQIGTVTFDVPGSSAPSLWKNGNVNISNFGVEGLPHVQSEIGAIRTYQ